MVRSSVPISAPAIGAPWSAIAAVARGDLEADRNQTPVGWPENGGGGGPLEGRAHCVAHIDDERVGARFLHPPAHHQGDHRDPPRQPPPPPGAPHPPQSAAPPLGQNLPLPR